MTPEEPPVSIVIPFRDEGPNLRPLLSEISRLKLPGGSKFEIIMVDDASTDGYCVEEEFRSGPPQIKVIRLPSHAGQSAAMHAGMQQAAGFWIVTMDGDLQNDPADIPRMISIAEEGNYDLVAGWRRRNCEGAARRFSSLFANLLRITVLGDSANDAGCTLKVMKQSFARKLPSWDGAHRFITSYATIWNCRQTQIEVNHRKRLHGRSKVRHFPRALSALRGLLRVRREKKRWTASDAANRQKFRAKALEG